MVGISSDSTDPTIPRKQSFERIQYLRGIAAYMVVISHFANIHQLGSFGVAIFFSISGFIMTITSWADFGRRGSAVGFLERRMLRIYPLWWLTLAAKSLIDSRAKDPAWVFGSILLLPIAAPNGLIEPIHGVGWSLVWEMVFYLIFSLSLIVSRNIGIIFVVSVLLALTVIGYLIPEFKASAWHGNQIFILFLVGVIVGILAIYSIEPINPRYSLVIGVLLSIFLLARGSDGVVYELAFAVASALIVYSCALLPNPKAENLVSHFLHTAGNASYSLYLTHTLILSAMIALQKRNIVPLDGIMFIAIGVIMSTVVAILVHKSIEIRLINYSKKLHKKMRGDCRDSAVKR